MLNFFCTLYMFSSSFWLTTELELTFKIVYCFYLLFKLIRPSDFERSIKMKKSVKKKSNIKSKQLTNFTIELDIKFYHYRYNRLTLKRIRIIRLQYSSLLIIFIEE